MHTHGRNAASLALAFAALTLDVSIVRPTQAGSFSATGALNAPRRLHTAAVLPNGKVLVAGGENGGGKEQSYSEGADEFGHGKGL